MIYWSLFVPCQKKPFIIIFKHHYCYRSLRRISTAPVQTITTSNKLENQERNKRINVAAEETDAARNIMILISFKFIKKKLFAPSQIIAWLRPSAE